MYKLIDGILNRLSDVFNLENIGNLLADWITDITVILVVFGVFYLIWKLVEWISKPVFSRSSLDRTTRVFVRSLIKYGILTIGLVAALDSSGIKTSAVLASLGIVGLTIGFAARDSLSNIISGLIIYLDRPFVIGDLVEIEGHYGRVERITLRSTRVVTADGKMLAVPNIDVINKTVASFTNFPHLRIDVGVTIAVNEDIVRVRNVLLGVIEGDTGYMDDPEPRVVVKELNDYNNLVELQVWIYDEHRHVEHRYRLREKIFKALHEAGIEMPFETIALTPVTVKMAQLHG